MTPFIVPRLSMAQRAGNVRAWAAVLPEGPGKARLRARAAVLEDASNHATASTLALPLTERAPALAKWAMLILQRPDGMTTPIERAAAYELIALAYEEAGRISHAQLLRKEAAHALGARLETLPPTHAVSP